MPTPPFQLNEEVICTRRYSLSSDDNQLEAGDSAVIVNVLLYNGGASPVEDWSSTKDGFWHFHAKSEEGLVDRWALPMRGERESEFKRPSELSDEDREIIEKTKNYHPRFRIYSEFTTGLFRIFWKSRHPRDDEWRELGRQWDGRKPEPPPLYSTLELAEACVERVWAIPRRELLRFNPEKVNDPVFGRVAKEIQA